MKLPRIVALCGNPSSGKTTAAELLHEIYDYEILDDGLPMRRIAVDYLGLEERHVFTQEGKEEIVQINGRDMQAREVLGEIGNAFENIFGADVIPLMAYNTTSREKTYVVGSVRREQGHFWRQVGAVVIEIENPEAPVSPYEFDRYSKTAVDYTVVNDGLAEGMHEDDALLRLANRLKKVLER